MTLNRATLHTPTHTNTDTLQRNLIYGLESVLFCVASSLSGFKAVAGCWRSCFLQQHSKMKLIFLLPIILNNIGYKRQPMITWSLDDQTWDVYLCLTPSAVSARTRPLVGIICSINLVSPLRPCFMPPMVWAPPRWHSPMGSDSLILTMQPSW